MLFDLASEGQQIKSNLDLWHLDFQDWKAKSITDDDRSLLATVYYHAVSIFLSGIFDYRVEFNDVASPELRSEVIQFHLTGILTYTKLALINRRLGGILFFFPLRVAGARAKTVEQKETITLMFNNISERNFVVAGAFTTDLHNLWSSR